MRLIKALVAAGLFAFALSAHPSAQSPNANHVVAGQIQVKFTPGATGQAKADAHRQGGGRVLNEIVSTGLQLVAVAAGDETGAMNRYRRNPNVLYAEPNFIRSVPEPIGERAPITHVPGTETIPGDHLFKEQWALHNTGQLFYCVIPEFPDFCFYVGTPDADIDAPEAWAISTGHAVTVAVIDTGIDYTHPDLAANYAGGIDYVTPDGDPMDDHGHGTHVAGTIAQTTNNAKGTAGLAFCATLMPIKVLSKQGYGTVADVAEGIRFAADNGAQVINMSLGGPIKSKILEDAVAHANGKGVLIVAAAGNSGRSVGYPAAYPGVFAVSATDSNDKIAWFSSRGPEVGIGAPGVAVTQQTICEGGKNKCEIFGTFNGTSMASPHVAGAAAMVVSMGVTDAASVRSALEASAKPKPQEEKNLFGAGILDAAAAVARAHWLHVGMRLAALFALFAFVAARIKKSRGELALTPLAIGGALVGAVGLLPIAPMLHLGSVGLVRPIVELLMRPFGEWDLVFGAGLHRWLPLANALPAMIGVALLFGSKRLRPGVGGFALGSAALLAQIAFSADVAFGLGALVLRAWMVANVLVCIWMAQMCLDRKTA
jgi:serine protease